MNKKVSTKIIQPPEPIYKEELTTDGDDYITKTYRLKRDAVEAIEEMTNRFSKETRIKLAMSKILELAIFNAQRKSLEELLNFKIKE